jgi:hypothetical protein
VDALLAGRERRDDIPAARTAEVQVPGEKAARIRASLVAPRIGSAVHQLVHACVPSA